jgi:Flp pilus assembly protein TadD
MINEADFQSAATLLTGYLKVGKGSAEGHRLLAYSYLRLNDPKHSLEEYTSAAAIERPGAIDLQNVAKDYVLLGDTTSAEHWIRVALGMNDRDPESWYELGRIQYTQQHFQEAVDCFQRVLVLAPESVKAENNLGLAYEGLNRNEAAVAAYRQAIAWQQRAPRPSEQPLINLGIMLVHQGKLDDALLLLVQAVTIAPRDLRGREELGHLCLQMKRLDQAQDQLQVAAALEPDKASIHFLLGRVYHLEGKESKAKEEFALATSLSGEKSTPDRP